MRLKYILIASLLLFVSIQVFGKKGDDKDPVDYVDVFIGTANDQGQLDPSASVPYGMVKVGPDCVKPSHVGYDFERTLISGFSINRLSGVGCRGAGGNLSIRPEDSDVELHIKKGSEKAQAGYYSTELSNGVAVELTASNNVAIERYVFPESKKEKPFFIDFSKSFAKFAECKYEILSNNEISGWISAANPCNEGRYTFYFYLKSDKEFVIANPTDTTVLLHINSASPDVEMRIAISGVSIADAKTRYQEIENIDLVTMKNAARNLWNGKLKRIIVEGDDDKRMFYTSLYRVMLTPSNVTSSDGYFMNSVGQIEKAEGYTYYSSWSLWDTYRTKFPLLTILDPDGLSEFCQSLVKLYQTGKKPWSTMHESTPTTRTEHSSIILLDAYRKGIKGIDFSTFYPQLVAEVEAFDLKSPDNYLEAAYDYWALSEIAKIVGNDTDHKKYAEIATNTWQKIWIEKFKDIKPETFDVMHGDGLYEGTLWQYRWAVPFDIDGLAKLAGGKKVLCDQLSYFFENDLYNQGNQPDIHAPFIFNRLGDSKQAQIWVNKILTKPMNHRYGTHNHLETPYYNKAFKPEPRAYIPEMDDDDATMAAWYVLASMGVFPLNPGEPIYELTTPVFDRITIQTQSGKPFIIVNNRKSKDNIIIKKILLNGKIVKNFQLSHRDIANGGLMTISY